MELYLLIALIFIYFVSVWVGNKQIIKRIWTWAFILSFVMMGVSLETLRLSNEDVMLSAEQFNWYYFLYVFAALLTAIGIINAWIYRRELWRLCQKADDDDKEQLL